jgi:hypothetical protein
MTDAPVISYPSRPIWWRCWLAQLLAWLRVGSAQALGAVSTIFWLMLVPLGLVALTACIAEVTLFVYCFYDVIKNADPNIIISSYFAACVFIFIFNSLLLLLFSIIALLVVSLAGALCCGLVIGLQIWLDLGRRHFRMGVWFLPLVTLLGALLVSALIGAVGRYEWPTLLWLFPSLTVALWLLFATFWLPVVCVDMGWWMGARLLA